MLVIDPIERIDILKCLASEVRLRILDLLKRNGPRNVNQVAEELGLPQSTVSSNIQVLVDAGLVQTGSQKARKGSQKLCHSTFTEARRAGLAADDLLPLPLRLEARPRHRTPACDRGADLQHRSRGARPVARHGRVYDADGGSLTFFAINRHGNETMETDLVLEEFDTKSVDRTIIRHDDLESRSTRDTPDTVTPQKASAARIGGRGLALTLPPQPYSMIRVRL